MCVLYETTGAKKKTYQQVATNVEMLGHGGSCEHFYAFGLYDWALFPNQWDMECQFFVAGILKATIYLVIVHTVKTRAAVDQQQLRSADLLHAR